MVWYGMVWYGMVWYGMYVCIHIHTYACRMDKLNRQTCHQVPSLQVTSSLPPLSSSFTSEGGWFHHPNGDFTGKNGRRMLVHHEKIGFRLVKWRTGWWFGCHEFYFPNQILGSSNHPNWRTPSFFRGVQTQPPTRGDHGDSIGGYFFWYFLGLIHVAAWRSL